MSMFDHTYDNSSKDAILSHAKQMLGKCLNDIIARQYTNRISEASAIYGTNRKGHFGNLVEEYVFGLTPNSSPYPDFPEAGVELKTTPLKKSSRNRLTAKERLVFSMIDYLAIVDEKWETSSFLQKNRSLLLMFYLFEKELAETEYQFKIIELINILDDLPPKDIAIIRQDWETIVEKVKNGKAHELSEGDTFYLGACTKGATAAKSLRDQPFSTEKARSRAFSLKQRYINFLIAKFTETAEDYESLLDPESQGSLSDSVLGRFSPFIGMTTDEIAQRLDVSVGSKDRCAILARKMLGVRTRKIEEFEKANILMKTMRITHTGRPKECMSFPAFRYTDIIEEDWEESSFKEILSGQKFLFVIYKFDDKTNKTLRLHKVMFWNMPYKDIETHVKTVWEETVRRIKDGSFEDLPGAAFDPVCHVRPHGTKGETFPTHTGITAKKQSFWLSSQYIRKQINN